MSKNASNAVNQQGSLRDPSETTRQAPFFERTTKAYFLGCLHDGTFSSNKRFRISQKGTEWLKELKNLLRQIGYSSWIYKEGRNRNVYVLETLAKFLNFNFDPKELKTKEEKIAYIRGFFDAEGGIPHSLNSRFYIQLVQSDKEKMDRIKSILEELGIKTGMLHNPSKKVNPNYWRLYVLSESKERFINEVGSWHPEKIKILKERVKI